MTHIFKRKKGTTLRELPANRGQKGFIQIVVVIIIGLVILRLLQVNIIDILSKPAVKDFALYVKDMLKLVWADLISIFNFAKGI